MFRQNYELLRWGARRELRIRQSRMHSVDCSSPDGKEPVAEHHRAFQLVMLRWPPRFLVMLMWHRRGQAEDKSPLGPAMRSRLFVLVPPTIIQQWVRPVPIQLRCSGAQVLRRSGTQVLRYTAQFTASKTSRAIFFGLCAGCVPSTNTPVCTSTLVHSVPCGL